MQPVRLTKLNMFAGEKTFSSSSTFLVNLSCGNYEIIYEFRSQASELEVFASRGGLRYLEKRWGRLS